MLNTTYGMLPSLSTFTTAWDTCDQNGELRNGLYHIRLGRTDSDALEEFSLGDGAYTCDELYWSLVEIVIADSEKSNDTALDFVSDILSTLNIEWM